MIRAVVLDIGSVLEVIDDAVFPAPFERRHGLEPGAVHAAAATLPGDAVLGGVSEAEVRAHWQRQLALSEEQTDWCAAQRPARRTGIVANSGPGAREAERVWGFEAITDDIVYSHEVGLAKPDPEIFRLAARRLGVLPSEVVFLDDVEGHVEAARGLGVHGVVHTSTPDSIREVERIIAAEEARQ